jgi:hypothetical protein
MNGFFFFLIIKVFDLHISIQVYSEQWAVWRDKYLV